MIARIAAVPDGRSARYLRHSAFRASIVRVAQSLRDLALDLGMEDVIPLFEVADDSLRDRPGMARDEVIGELIEALVLLLREGRIAVFEGPWQADEPRQVYGSEAEALLADPRRYRLENEEAFGPDRVRQRGEPEGPRLLQLTALTSAWPRFHHLWHVRRLVWKPLRVTETRVEPHRLQVHVDIDCATLARYREVALWWLDSLHERFVDQPGFDVHWARRLESGWGYAPDGRPIVAGEYDQGARRRFEEVLGPGHGHFVVYGTHGGGRRPVGFVDLKCSTLGGEPTKAEVHVELGLIKTATPADVNGVEAIVVGLVRGFLDRWRPLFVGVSDDFEQERPALDMAQKLNSRVARLDSGTYLRGYCWVTYCPNHLRRSLPDLGEDEGGAFTLVTELPDGVLLQATEHLRDFYGDRVRAVRHVLSPVLRERPAVHPKPPGARLGKRHLRIAWDDGTNGPFAPRASREELLNLFEEWKARPASDGSGSR